MPAERDEQISRALNEFVDRCAAGEHVSERDFLAQYPDLAPHLGQRLRDLALIENARRKAFAPDTRPPVTDADATRVSVAKLPRRASASGSSRAASFHGRFLPGTVLAERYRVVALIGAGGMGEVYRADDLELGQPVALKFLPAAPRPNEEELERLRNEVRIARQVAHPNVCRVYDIGECHGDHFICMEYVDGENLATLLRRVGAPSIEKAKQIARQICEGLGAIHRRGILHGDLKPANVMIDGRGAVRITDFGVAGFIPDLMAAEKRGGTPAYMSPEQLSGGDLSVQSDLYALGLVLHELFGGQRAPLDTGSDATAIADRAPVGAALESLDELVERAVAACLEYDPRDRPTSAAAVAANLPGFDPLSAALAAGETPSPELVASAGASGAIEARVASALLLGLAGVLALIAWLNQLTGSSAVVPLQKPPAVLADQAERILRALGHRERPADRAFGLGWRDAPGGDAAGYFWYRDSPRGLVPTGGGSRVTLQSPPPMTPGMATLILDPSGRLRSLEIVPPEADAPSPTPQPVDWAPVLAAAGYDGGSLRPIAPSARRVFASDERAAWNVVDRSGAPIARIEAAALNGRIQSFETQAASGAGAAPSAGSLAGPQAALFIVRAAVLVGCAWFARRNLKLRRADRVGAARLGVTVLCVSLASQLLGARWFGLNEAEWQLLLRSLGACLFTSAFGWTVYLAVEPYVRRAWPHRMTSWTRLLAGRWRDPLVGRDVLIGVCVSAVVIAVLLGHVLMADALGAPRPRFATFEVVDANLAANLVVSAILLKVTSGGVFNALFVLAVLVVLLALTGRKRVAEVGFGAVMFLLQLAVTSRAAPWMALLLAAVGAAYVSLTLLRFGLLALVVALFGVFTLWDFPLTLDVRAWHAGSALFACGVLVALAGLGAWVATGGAQPGRPALR